MDILYKVTKELDFEQMVDILYETKCLRHPKKRKIYKAAIEKAFQNSQFVVSAWHGTELAGFARVLTDESLYASIWNFMVSPKYQKKGIGKQLINKCLEKYPKLNFFLFAGDNSADFYRKMGFEIHPHGMNLKKGPDVCVIYN
ncbi:MAG: GNAT family acetyltransferase [Candidatus Gottesmanbacteria bacterium GW2011_GWA2_43_14]|uniref:GNAT family acetyltransferase n=1 Tax=Candidatus Gottesmanbacteria bacterium GW2011_GWA2_43_14 TaxID=1618443 RepID=A0A0G1FT92_9BACT|nr:MAG: GNAT family acetyltransferase [Candidatus Gottesmanbacteria bacterium GW2011_GWA2_43_14]